MKGWLQSRGHLVDRFRAAMTTYQNRIEHDNPIILLKNHPTPDELLLAVKLAGQVRDALDAIELQKLNLLRDRAKLRQLQNRWMTPHPITQLPPELLSYIFLFVDTRPDFKEGSAKLLYATPPIFESGRLPTPVVLSHVSADWRSLVLGTASMWNWIDVRGGETSLSRVSTWLARSGGMPLHLHVLLEEGRPPSDIANVIIPHLQRVKDMQIFVRSANGMEFLSLLASASDPSATCQLRVLKVHYNRRTSTFSGAFLRFQEHQRAFFSQLDLLLLNGIGISGWPHWRVENVHIHLMDDLGPSMTWYKVFGVLLPGLPLLKELEISTLFDLETGAPDQVLPSIARFPSLSKIKVQASPSTIQLLLAVMDAPSLASLEIGWWLSWGDDPIPSAMTEFVRRHPSLQQLMLGGGGDDGLADVLKSIPFAPSLEALTLRNSQGPGDLGLKSIRPALPNLPNLRHLNIEQMRFSLEELQAVLLDIQQPLSVQLSSCHLTIPTLVFGGHTEFPTEPDLEALARDLSEREVTLAWSQVSFDPPH
ncbi:hypothetical protein FRC01_002556 [Tulasnella sp. 417]|nr:hypothetical protein FRC01_002556 [Tulasnella sp. 417]